LFFIYGGGFTTGDRSQTPPFNLIHACFGAFFAQRGFITIIPDYRLSPEYQYPDAAHDVLDSIKWTISNSAELVLVDSESSLSLDLDSLFIVGHSAGAVHTVTLFFHEDLVPLDDEIRKRVQGVVLISGPYRLLPGDYASRALAQAHWGTIENAIENSSHSLLIKWFADRDPSSLSSMKLLPEILMVVSEKEPVTISETNSQYHKMLEWYLGKKVDLIEAKGHNHVTLIYMLSSGHGEEWADQVAAWMREVMRGDDKVEVSWIHSRWVQNPSVIVFTHSFVC